MSRRAALKNRLAMFEKTIAENEKHGGGGRNFVSTIASTPMTSKNRFARRKPMQRLSAVSEDPTSPTAEASTSSFSAKESDSFPILPALGPSSSSSSSSCQDDCKDLLTLPPLPASREELAESLSMIRFELDALEDEPETKESKETESELVDIMNHLEASMALNFDIDDEEEEEQEKEQDDNLRNAHDSKAFDKSLSDLYDGTNMLMDWDVNQSALRYRAWKERKSKVDTGAKISLKDRMKAFGGK